MLPDFPLQIKHRQDDLAQYAQALGHILHKGDHLRTLIDNLPDYIYFKDTQSRFIDANKATVRIMKCKTREEIIGKTDFDFYPKQFAEHFYRDEQEILSTGQSKFHIEETVINENGQLRFLSTSKIALIDEDNKIIGLVGIGRDITEAKMAEDVLKRDKETFERLLQERTAKLLEIQDAYKRVQRLSDMGMLAAIVAHELRHPLGVINMAVESMKKKQVFSEQNADLIQKSLAEGNKIIDNLLTYSRIKAPSYKLVSLTEVLDESIHAMLSQNESRHITVKRHYEIHHRNQIKADYLQLKEVFCNILNNAAQAIQKSHGMIEVVVKPVAEAFVVTVRDNGIGIAPEDLEKIFQPFFSRKSKGTGLGLAICKELVELHRGKIEVTSRKSEGTEFKVHLPFGL